MASSSTSVNKVFQQWWKQKTTARPKKTVESDSDSGEEQAKRKRRKTSRKKKTKRPPKTSTFKTHTTVPLEKVTKKSHPQVRCIENHFAKKDTNAEVHIAETNFFNRNNEPTDARHMNPFLYVEARAAVQTPIPKSFNINDKAKRDALRPKMEPSPRAHEEKYLVEPDKGKGERECVMGRECEGLRIQCPHPFVLQEFFLPSEEKQIQTSGRRPAERKLCLLCKRNEICRCLLNSRADLMGIQEGVTLQDYYNIVNIEGEYKTTDCICSKPQRYEGLWEPVVRHTLSGYKLETDANGRRRYDQWKYSKPSFR